MNNNIMFIYQIYIIFQTYFNPKYNLISIAFTSDNQKQNIFKLNIDTYKYLRIQYQHKFPRKIR